MTSVGYQLDLDGMPATDQVVNVASVPQRSPFRYPGGKTWLIPRVRQWLRSLPKRPSVLVEPFAGGAIVGLTVAFERLAEKVVLVELDEQVAAVWKTILSDDCEWLVGRMLSFTPTSENVRAELANTDPTTPALAFRTLVKNRTYHGGILAPGSRPMKNGENGRGLKSRWYPETLAGRIRAIASIRDRISFTEGDGIAAIRAYGRRKSAAFFIDPPYTAAGKKAGTRLYTYHALDHEKLFLTMSRVAGDFLTTYDNAEEVAALAVKHGMETRTVAMKNTHHAQMTELLIGRDLSWLR